MRENFQRFDPHSERVHRLAMIVGVVVIVILAFLVRKSLIKFENPDYLIFASWYDYVRAHGIASFHDAFSNYNPPYTYFLYLVTLLPLHKIVAIKSLMFLFDALLAVSVYYVVRAVKPRGYLAIAAALGSLFLPVVVATGVFWGQFDQLYTAFTLFSLAFLLRNNGKLAWLFFGVAIAIKLQAIFFLPVLVVMSLKRIRLWEAVYGVGAFVVLTFLPLLAGRSLSSLLLIYKEQTTLFNGNLTLNAPNIYQWVPNSAFAYLNDAGLYAAVALMVGFALYAIRYKKFSDDDVISASALSLFVLPFVLPQIHERYFFSATVASFILACVRPKYAWIAVVMQLTTLFSYAPFLFGSAPPVPFVVLAIVGVVMSTGLIVAYITPAAKLKLAQRK